MIQAGLKKLWRWNVCYYEIQKLDVKKHDSPSIKKVPEAAAVKANPLQSIFPVVVIFEEPDLRRLISTSLSRIKLFW